MEVSESEVESAVELLESGGSCLTLLSAGYSTQEMMVAHARYMEDQPLPAP